MAGIALGSSVGAAMVASGLAFGHTVVALDGLLSRLLAFFVLALLELMRLSRMGLDLRAGLLVGSELLVAGRDGCWNISASPTPRTG
jgi:hypothetical protein